MFVLWLEADGLGYRVFLTTYNKSGNLNHRLRDPLHSLRRLLLDRLLSLQAEMLLRRRQILRISTCSKPPPPLLVSALGVVVEVVLGDLETLISFVTTHNFNNYVKLFNSNHKCLSRSCNKWDQETLSLPL